MYATYIFFCTVPVVEVAFFIKSHSVELLQFNWGSFCFIQRKLVLINIHNFYWCSVFEQFFFQIHFLFFIIASVERQSNRNLFSSLPIFFISPQAQIILISGILSGHNYVWWAFEFYLPYLFWSFTSFTWAVLIYNGKCC